MKTPAVALEDTSTPLVLSVLSVCLDVASADMTHGAPDASVRHFGDLGNFEANEYGVGQVAITDNLVSLVGPADRSVLGRAIVIHADEDDLGLGGDEGSLATGNAGARVGCCVIMES